MRRSDRRGRPVAPAPVELLALACEELSVEERHVVEPFRPRSMFLRPWLAQMAREEVSQHCRVCVARPLKIPNLCGRQFRIGGKRLVYVVGQPYSQLCAALFKEKPTQSEQLGAGAPRSAPEEEKERENQNEAHPVRLNCKGIYDLGAVGHALVSRCCRKDRQPNALWTRFCWHPEVVALVPAM